MKLSRHLVEKPWGRRDIPSAFGDVGGRQIGELWFEAPGSEKLPTLVKWLFTSDRLSIQVHPDDMEARSRGLPSGKEECWYIVSAEPGSVIGLGTTRVLSADELREASLSGRIEELMDWKAVEAGDYFYVPAGTVHAIGAGITLVEVQQYADVTYRLYDYGRLDHGRARELHLDDGVAVSAARPYTDMRSGQVTGSRQLVSGPHFDLWYVDDAQMLAAAASGRRRWLVPLRGTVAIDDETACVGECLQVEPGALLEGAGEFQMLVVA